MKIKNNAIIMGYSYNEKRNNYAVFFLTPNIVKGVQQGFKWKVDYSGSRPTHPAYMSSDDFEALRFALGGDVIGKYVDVLYNEYGNVKQFVPVEN